MTFALGLAFSGSLFAADNNMWQASGSFCSSSALQPENTAPSPARSSGEGIPPNGATRITADALDGQTNRHHRASGNVIVERGDEILNAEQIDYDQTQGLVSTEGAFTLTRSGSQTVQGENLQYNLNERSGTAHNTRFDAEADGRRLQGSAENLHLHNGKRYSADSVKFNSCRPGDTSWYIQAARLDADNEKGIGVARHAKLVFGGIPILYTPWADFPLNGGRKSGFLAPTLSGGSDGFSVELPYYFNLAPNYDATLSPKLLTKRGIQFNGEFRYLQPNYSGSLHLNYLPHDRLSPHSNRYRAIFQHSHRFTEAVSGGIDFTQVSDDDYYRDLHNITDTATSVNLNRSAWLDYKHHLAGGYLDARLLVQKYQTLSDDLGNKNPPYSTLPKLSANWQRHFGNLALSVHGSATRFDSSSKQSGNRFVFYPGLQWDIHNSWGYIRPKIGVHSTHYRLNRFEDIPSRSVNRTLPVMNVESGITLERDSRIFGRNYVQTLEPKLFYNYIPSKQQNSLPNFDSSENDFSYAQLFRENIYSGSDRINAANSLSLGLQSKFLDKHDGTELFRAGIGQKYHFSSDNVLLDGRIDSTPRRRSDLILFGSGKIHSDWYAESNWHYSENRRTTERFNAGLRYNPAAGKTVSLRYKYSRKEEIYNGFYGNLRHIDFAAQWPLTPNLYALGRLNYSIRPRSAIEQSIGLEYKNPCGCWSLSALVQRYASGISDSGSIRHKTAFFVTLQLKGLSNVGSNPYKQLHLGIPGYTKTNEVNP